MEYLEEVGSVRHLPDGVFCVPLEGIQSVNNVGIPLVAIAFMEFVESEGLETVGIYRLSSTKSKMEDLRRVLAAGHYAELKNREKWDINTVSCLFKQWLRELSHPLCTFELYDSFVRLAAALKASAFKEVIAKLPHNYKIVLQAVLKHLNQVTSRSSVNKMEALGLGAIFGPNIIRPEFDSAIQIEKQNAVMEFMIKNVADIF